MISPSTSFAYFSILTTMYFVMRYFLLDKYRKDKKPNKSLSIGLMVTYLAIMDSLQLSANLSNVKEKCGGDPQIAPALMYTLIPNVFIFGALIVGLLLFPGWKAPFSNTIGYLIVCLPTMKIKDVFNNDNYIGRFNYFVIIMQCLGTLDGFLTGWLNILNLQEHLNKFDALVLQDN